MLVPKGRCATLAQRVPRAKRRRCVTFVGLICDSPAMQRVLPQFLVGNAVTFKAREMEALRAACPDNVVLIRQKSAWNNDQLMAKIVQRLAVVLAPYMAAAQPILLFDAAPCHLNGRVLSRGRHVVDCAMLAGRVFRACEAARIWPCVIPPKLTWRLQPLDTHCFLSFKSTLQQIYQRRRATTSHGEVETPLFLQCVYETIRRVMNGRAWRHAFEHNDPTRAGRPAHGCEHSDGY